jgi:hypothetical protein
MTATKSRGGTGTRTRSDATARFVVIYRLGDVTGRGDGRPALRTRRRHAGEMGRDAKLRVTVRAGEFNFFHVRKPQMVSALVVFLYALAYKFRDARVRRGLRLILVSARLSAPTMLKNFNIDTHKCNK